MRWKACFARRALPLVTFVGSLLGGLPAAEAAPGQAPDAPTVHLIDGEPGTVTMRQAGGWVVLEAADGGPVRLDGTPQVAIGSLRHVLVSDRREGAPWALTASITDLTLDGEGAPCPSTEPTLHRTDCIPGDNLAWRPGAALAWPLDGAAEAVRAGELIPTGAPPGGGLASAPRVLCTSGEVPVPGTYACGAGLALLIPASTSAGTYRATITLTLV